MVEVGFWDDGIGAKLKCYFTQIAILYVYDECASNSLEQIFSAVGSKFSKISTKALLQKEQSLNSHLVILDISPANAKEFRALFAKFSSLETILFLDEDLKKRVFGCNHLGKSRGSYE